MIQEQDTLFWIILNKKKYPLQSKFRYLNEVDQDIFNELIMNKKYEVKSSVSENTLISFIKYWTNKEIPIFNESNISEYDQLSQEFDIMKDVLQIYEKFMRNLILLSRRK